ncbi:MAG TPA: formate transporter FocA [Longimicrobiales bacterium]|nr:formate transporter FocA [Longimicrobiales bacterium]
MARRAEEVGAAKAAQDAVRTLALAVLAGAFIALGAMFATTVASGAGPTLPSGVVRLLSGLVFSLGLILVVVGGAELFTGNNLIVMAWASRRLSHGALLRNWSIVYLGNFAGAMGTVLLVLLSQQYMFDGGAIGGVALATARHKVELGFLQAIVLGILANGLVCLAVWLAFSARTTTDRILAVIFPITAFVAAGFEHSIANMYFVPLGILIRRQAPASFWAAIDAAPADYSGVTWPAFLLHNLLPVTIGNVIGGVVLVGVTYWFVYLRTRQAHSEGRA